MFEPICRIMRRILARAAVLVLLLLTIAALFAPLAVAQAIVADAESARYAEWYRGFCSLSPADQALLFQIVAWVAGPVAGAALLANLRGIMPGWLVTLVDLVGANWAPIVRRLMDGGTKPALIALAALGLAACSADQLKLVEADIATGIAAACQDVGRAAALPGADPTIKLYADAACPLATASASLVQSSATLQWLGALEGQLAATAATAAK